MEVFSKDRSRSSLTDGTKDVLNSQRSVWGTDLTLSTLLSNTGILASILLWATHSIPLVAPRGGWRFELQTLVAHLRDILGPGSQFGS